jgi:hypothetical protein
LPADTDVRAAFERGDYAETLKLLARVLSLKGKPTDGYDRYELTMIKGESHLRLKQFKAASDAFAAAAKLTDDPAKAATARATHRLVLEAKSGRVQRRTPARGGEPTTADLLNPDQRDDALRIVHADLRAAAEPKVKEARRARILPPIAEALELVAVTCDFEAAIGPTATSGGGDSGAGDKHDKTDAENRDELTGRALELMEKELANAARDVAQIKKTAESVEAQRYVARQSVTYGVAESGEYVPLLHGLEARDRKDLKAILDTCAKLLPAAESLAKLPGVDADRIKKVTDAAKQTHREATRVLTRKYGK